MSGAHAVSCSVGTASSFPELKRPGNEADFSPPFNVDGKNEWSHALTSPVFLRGVYRTTLS